VKAGRLAFYVLAFGVFLALFVLVSVPILASWWRLVVRFWCL
jgi:hypothetical protein